MHQIATAILFIGPRYSHSNMQAQISKAFKTLSGPQSTPVIPNVPPSLCVYVCVCVCKAEDNQ